MWGFAQYAALLPLAAGCAAYLWCVWDFATFGRGTPAPIDAPRRLVVRGLYRHVRNPMYVGVLLVIAGWAILFQSARVLGYGATAALFFHLFVVAVEEPTLRGKFGRSYEQYCRDVGRWVPKVRRGRGLTTPCTRPRTGAIRAGNPSGVSRPGHPTGRERAGHAGARRAADPRGEAPRCQGEGLPI